MDKSVTIKPTRRWMNWFLIESTQLMQDLPWQRGNRHTISELRMGGDHSASLPQ